ncbi:hypothetical protein [Salipiger bermudensis]|uniref:hypothetical protein n=1 Tax=Salipiger bermudensis TaxID=344736 RepID=UPI001A8F2D2E|nr:hypothetical protein [Salipiger bermudensis]MBN9675067.1 hypothetical protein [Salipiger bermudensis]
MSIAKLYTWFGIPRRTVYYKPVKAAPKVDPRFADPIKKMIEEEPSFGHRTVAWLLGFNKNTVQRIFQIKGWRFASVPWACGPASRRFRLSQLHRTRGGRPISPASGPARTAGPRWPW